MENGGIIFLRTAVVSYAADHLMLNVKFSASDFYQVNSFSPACNLTVYIKYPSMKLSLHKYSSEILVGFEPRFARFVKVTSK